MIHDVRSRRSVRLDRPTAGNRKRMRIEFTIAEAAALRIYKRKRGKSATYRSVLLDGLELLPGFSKVLKQENELYGNSQEEAVHPDAKRIEEEHSH